MARSRTRDDRGDDMPKRPEQVKRDGPYVVMLFITLVAVAVGCVLLYLDNSEYAGKSPPKETPNVRALGTELKSDGGTAPKL
ncbi:hypothetical protein VT84_35710 [Gemmata sp. SH-PL17]|uniref:hypothetical protein n=1 Tax=Gemmata sp. SH-PL17 TaxID=1630693 RepID=UPI0004B23F76|nr:hypothetical protein [Gemmata sp. SH-PL17]AMV29795.1 hypothetical protein VT84_35710 [Gemmata sp. SH-PL17]